ncbi:MAG: F0F1 ATP synthase subunit A [Thermoleophilaceae bacterium]
MTRRIAAALTPLGLLLASPAVALAIETNKEFKPQNEFKLDPIIPIELGPVDLSITKAVIYLFLAAVATCLTMILISRRMGKEKPGRMETAIEAAYDLTNSQITRGNIGSPGMAGKWFAFIATLFFFIWFNNMIGYIPLPISTEHSVEVFGLAIPTFALYAATANISVPLALTLVVWFSYHVEGVRAKGPIKYLKGWVPDGVDGKIVPFVFAIEVLSQLVRLVSLSARLFANILAGHLLILLMAGGMVVLLGVSIGLIGSVILGVFTGGIAILFYLFEVGLVASLQAYIFATLTAIYLGEAVAEEH